MTVPPVIFARDRLQARAYAERHRIRAWTWARTVADIRAARGRDIILLPGWMLHHLAPYAAEAFAATKPLSGTEVAQQRSKPVN